MAFKLFIPGPVQVSEKTFKALCQPMIGHRSGDFKKLYASIHPRLQELFATKQWDPLESTCRHASLSIL